jgi:NAD-dependent deacetylase
MKIVFLTGAGISAESGVPTFRGDGGLWENHNVDDVCSVEGWKNNRELVLNFYNGLRSKLKDIKPNKAHELIAELEGTPGFEVHIITTNCDDLHEKAGSKKILHIHGELLSARSTLNYSKYKWEKDIKIGDKCKYGSQLRPDIIFFGEKLDQNILDDAIKITKDADIFVIIGTSLQVYPAASLFTLTKENCYLYYVDPGECNLHMSDYKRVFFYHAQENATTGIEKVIDDIKSF